MNRGWIGGEYVSRMNKRRIYKQDGQKENIYKGWIGGEYLLRMDRRRICIEDG